jgi:hypothetical protein
MPQQLVDVTAADAERGAFETKPELKKKGGQGGAAPWPDAYAARMDEVLAALQAAVLDKVKAFHAEYQALP